MFWKFCCFFLFLSSSSFFYFYKRKWAIYMLISRSISIHLTQIFRIDKDSLFSLSCSVYLQAPKWFLYLWDCSKLNNNIKYIKICLWILFMLYVASIFVLQIFLLLIFVFFFLNKVQIIFVILRNGIKYLGCFKYFFLPLLLLNFRLIN